ncbi:hypothetical protein O6H91_12G059600 [Diphasiastrum complanatum]|uniref:Uncharacterized protein n=1 Tax=Diphasiastrum complanatum TaxID=34168 RepID=A0ACC2C2P5_DIPCM|nr:hypothetical protein O6H91_Y309200 [Diphasiastrum complanatum]KAJ7536197.1 hypothetical protein O6H91_12G059600 [Diphasiastrum complanatum]
MGKHGQSILLVALLCVAIGFSLFSMQNSLLGCSQIVMTALGSNPPRVTFSAGPCNCFVDYVPSFGKPSVGCNCSRIDPPVCKPAEVRIVEKEPIRETVKEVVKEPCPDIKQDPAPVVQNIIKREPWWAEEKVWHYPLRFPRCSMDACFNYSRCENANELLIYSYDLPSPPVRYFSRIRESKWHTSDPDKACLFFVFLDAPGPWPPHPKELPFWNGGLNHVLIIFADKWSQKGPFQDSIGFASVLASDIHETTYRPGFDISIPLPANYHINELQKVKPFDRQYLLAFRGLRYLGYRGEGTLRSHVSFRTMHNGKDVIVATSCKHSTNNLKRKEKPALGAYCEEDEAIYGNYTYNQLMNSTFGLVPAGVQPSSYRFGEVLSAGTIPVLIADNYVKPFDTLFQWHCCILQFPSTEMHRIVPTVRALKREELEKRQQNCLEINRSFRDNDALLETTIRALKARFMGAFPKLSDIQAS